MFYIRRSGFHCKKITLSYYIYFIICYLRYCLDDRGAVAKDSQLASLQSSHVKLETLSSCVKTDHRPVEKRASRAVTKVAKNDKKQNLMKLSVPLIRTKAAGKDRKPANVGRYGRS